MPEDSIETGEKLNLPQEPKPKQQRVTRRFLLKAGAAAIGAAALGWRESQIIESGIKTPTGTFYPLYESHTQGIKPEDLRDDLDACSFELNLKKTEGAIYSGKPAVVLYNWEFSSGWEQDTKELLKRKGKILEKLAGNKTRVVFGDLEVSYDLIEWEGEPMATRIGKGVGILGASAYLLARFDEKVALLFDKKEIPRRSVLKTIGKVALLASIPPNIGNVIQEKVFTNLDNLDARQKDAGSRIAFRLQGLASHLDPENHLLFFRNLIMADKILTVAEAIKKETGKRPKIAFNVGAAHVGMEDFLMAGHDFCRWLLSNYPPDFIENVAETNGGLENFCTARVLTLLPVRYSELLGEEYSAAIKLMTGSREVSIKDERIIDQPLFQSLSGRRLANALK